MKKIKLFISIIAFTLAIGISVKPTADINAAVVEQGQTTNDEEQVFSWNLDDAGVMTISGNGCFCEFNNMETIILPDGFKEIDEYAFSACESLKTVTIPASVTKVGLDAFYDCPVLCTV